MQTQETKQTYGIKGKLISAVAMLLVAIIMVVSSTYAWFTLSTAPEVTGISTAVGANGALEMLLLTQDENGQWVYNETIYEEGDKNTYWGNLVDVSSGYGLDNIVLYPSKLAASGNDMLSSILQFPTYGPDGRVSALSPAVTGIYEKIDDKSAFYPDNGYGVRAVGASSGKTERQLAYRYALSVAGTQMSVAKTEAAEALQTNGADLADIAVRRANGQDEYTKADVANLIDMTGILRNDVVPAIEEAYKQYIIAFAASNAIGTAPEGQEAAYESFYVNVENWFKENDADSTKENTIYTFADQTKGFAAETNLGITISLPDQVKTGIAALKDTRDNVVAADTALQNLYDTKTDADEIGWTEFSAALLKLVNIDELTVCGISVSGIREDTNAFVNKVAAAMGTTGIVLAMPTGGGVFADVADQCGDYDASITIEELKYGQMVIDGVPARMETESTVKPSYLNVVKGGVSGKEPASTGGANMPISEFYGYIIDLAFRTNAAESDLLLQTAPKDRIYSENTENELTWGKGSTMTFKSTTPDFSDAQVKALMKHIKIVFFTPAKTSEESNTILAYAKLDVDGSVTNVTTGVTANIYLYEKLSAVKCTIPATDGGAPVTIYKVGDTYYTDETCMTTYTLADGVVPTEGESIDVERFIKDQADAVIKGLTQNYKENISVLVYLDGETITNGDVAATMSKSMTGSMNLQFASSATLVPMDYAQYQTQNNNQGGTQNP